MTTSSEFPENPRSKSRDRISSFMLKKSSTSLDSATPWSREEVKTQAQKELKKDTGIIRDSINRDSKCQKELEFVVWSTKPVLQN